MSHTASEFITAVGNALANDTTLTEWCQDQFDRAPIIWEGNPVEADTLPAIAILGITGFGRSDGRGELSRQLIIGFALENEEMVTSGQKKIYTGFHQIEVLRETVENAIFRAKIGAISAEFSGDPDIRPPMFCAYSAIGLSELKSTRRRLPG